MVLSVCPVLHSMVASPVLTQEMGHLNSGSMPASALSPVEQLSGWQRQSVVVSESKSFATGLGR